MGVVGGLALLLAALVARTLPTEHAPWSTMYEFNQSFAAASLGAYLFLARRLAIHGLAPHFALVAAALIAYTLMLPSEIAPLPPALQTPFFLTVYVGSAILACGLYAVAGVAALGPDRPGPGPGSPRVAARALILGVDFGEGAQGDAHSDTRSQRSPSRMEDGGEEGRHLGGTEPSERARDDCALRVYEVMRGCADGAVGVVGPQLGVDHDCPR